MTREISYLLVQGARHLSNVLLHLRDNLQTGHCTGESENFRDQDSKYSKNGQLAESRPECAERPFLQSANKSCNLNTNIQDNLKGRSQVISDYRNQGKCHPSANLQPKILEISALYKPTHIRHNWSCDEDRLLLSSVEHYSHLSEPELVRKVVCMMEGNRTYAQVKHRFRTFLSKGVIHLRVSLHSDNDVQSWQVLPQYTSARMFRRSNWTTEEHRIMAKTVKEFSDNDEPQLILEIYRRLERGRNWLQVRKHFSFLKTTGRIRKNRDSSWQWYHEKQ